MIFRASTQYMLAVDTINEKLFDQQLITVSDYTVEGKVTPAMFALFRATTLIIGQNAKPMLTF